MRTASPSHSFDIHSGATLASESATAHSRAEYCYMFPSLADVDSNSLFVNPVTQRFDEAYTRARLRELAANLAIHPDIERKKKTLPAVYTYFGQFLSHDTTAPIQNSRPEHTDPPPPGVLDTGNELMKNSLEGPRPTSTEPILRSVLNQHINPITLESLYGGGPFEGTAEVKSFYESDLPVFKLGNTVRSLDLIKKLSHPEKVVPAKATPQPDLLRSVEERRPLIPDPRNEESLIIGQLHLAFMLFHNQAVKVLSAKIAAKEVLFEEARKQVTLHYQYCIIHDYLESILAPGSVKFALENANLLEEPNRVPLEFSTAAFRFGHSMVSDDYNYNANFSMDGPQKPNGSLATLRQLFEFTAHNGMESLPDHWVADWTRLTNPDAGPGRSEPIDPFIAGDMLNQGAPVLAHDSLEFASIITRNVLRGFYRRIPSGQSLANHINSMPLEKKINPPIVLLSKEQMRECLKATEEGPAKDALIESTPAWLYCLCEARVFGQGIRLGPLASYIIAGTIIGLLKLNDDSCLGKNNGNWSPEISPLKNSGGIPIKDIKGLLRFAGVMA